MEHPDLHHGTQRRPYWPAGPPSHQRHHLSEKHQAKMAGTDHEPREVEKPHLRRCKRLNNLASMACEEIATYQAICIRPSSISSRRDLFIFLVISSNFLIIPPNS